MYGWRNWPWWQLLILLPMVIVPYLIGFYLAGAWSMIVTIPLGFVIGYKGGEFLDRWW